MSDKNNKTNDKNIERPYFPKRAVITGGMPYGNKELHFGHVGGYFVHADTFSRFLRDRIGKENVIFLSGTDCYGSPIYENYRQLTSSGKFEGTIEEFVMKNHKNQKDVLDAFNISLDIYSTSGFGRSAQIHQEMSNEFINTLYENGHLTKLTTSQFYDTEHNVFLNGRQVVGRCPIAGCSSEKGYADECALGHQYMPVDLIDPKSTVSGKTPEMRDISNLYFKLNNFGDLLKEWIKEFKDRDSTRHFVGKTIEEFLEPPVIYVKRDQTEVFYEIKEKLPKHKVEDIENKPSLIVVFENLEDREEACGILSKNSIRFRTGKTLVPFRLTGNIEWGVTAPNIEGLQDLTIWVWPESLWAPISFTKTYLESQGKDVEEWKKWWCSKEAKVYQFIGEDNVYFYGPAEMAMFMAQQGNDPKPNPKEGDLQLPDLVVSNHILFLDKKASSSGKVRAPMAEELLAYYTSEQLRAHFLGLGLGIKSVSFRPKPLNPSAPQNESDPVLKEGNLLANVFNRAVRSCFYTIQKYTEGKIPYGEISTEIKDETIKTILDYERLMVKCEFHTVMNLMDSYIRNINKYWSKNIKEAEKNNDDALRNQTLIDSFHMVRAATTLMHPIAPEGTEMIREYLNLSEELWSWDNIFEPIYKFMNNKEDHQLKFLEPRVDFFKKHHSQLADLQE